MKQPSANKRRAENEELDRKTNAERVLDQCKIVEAIKKADPNWTSVLVYSDDKELRRKWMRTDKLNSEIL